MDKKFLLFDNYILNIDENIVGFIHKDIYLELDSEGIEMFKFLQEHQLLFSLSELRKRFELIDVDDLITELSELGLVQFVDNRNFITKSNETKSDSIYVSYIYVLSALLLVVNLLFLSNHFIDIFILDISYFGTPIMLFISMFILETILAYIHEWGHYLSARLLKINSTINISQRFILFLVFECKMNGIWLLDRNLRIFPILGGILMDNFIIFLCSMILKFLIPDNTFLFIVLFIQYTKMIYHLLIPFKTDLYYIVLFCFYGTKNGQRILNICNILGFLFLIPLIIVYMIQLKNLLLVMKDSSLFQIIIVLIILLSPIFMFIKERKKNE
ncbi:hypothetical protein [Streptococcus suis]